MQSINDDELKLSPPTDGKSPVVYNADLEEEEYYGEEYYEYCPKCGRDYNDIDLAYQSCSKCGWDEAEQKWGEAREPSDEDYENK